MLDSRILNADETTFKVQQNSTGEGKINGYLWSYIGDRKWVWFDWQPGRGQAAPMKLLEGFTGEYLQSDGYVVHDGIAEKMGLEQVAWWAHARRKFIEAKDAGFIQADEVIALITQLYKIEKEARQADLSQSKLKTNQRKSFMLSMIL